VFADGVALATLAKVHGAAPQGRVTGPSFMLAACEHGVARGWRHFFCGGAPGVAEKLAANLSTISAGLQVQGVCSPAVSSLTPDEESQLKHDVESSKTDLLWVGLGSPKQEYWIDEHLGKINVPVMLAVGARLRLSFRQSPMGSCHRASRWPRMAFRMLTGGRKTLVRNVKCVSKVAATSPPTPS